MKTRLLKFIRKYWEYTFCDGKLYMKRRVDGMVRIYDSKLPVQEFISHFIFNNMGMMSGFKWHERKKKISDKKKWAAAVACNKG